MKLSTTLAAAAAAALAAAQAYACLRIARTLQDGEDRIRGWRTEDLYRYERDQRKQREHELRLLTDGAELAGQQHRRVVDYQQQLQHERELAWTGELRGALEEGRDAAAGPAAT